jgi:hypothetical protein
VGEPGKITKNAGDRGFQLWKSGLATRNEIRFNGCQQRERSSIMH